MDKLLYCKSNIDEYGGMSLKKVLLLCQQGVPYETSPARYQLVQELKRKGYIIYVFNSANILYHEIRNDIDYFTNTRKMSQKEIRKKIKNIKPDYIIAFTDDDTRILFSLLWTMKKTCFIYFNLEIYTPEREQRRKKNKNKFFYPILWRLAFLSNKLKEIVFTKKCKVFIIQDNLRRKTSARYFIHHPNTLLIPNSYIYNSEDFVKEVGCGIVYSGILTKLRLEPLMEELKLLPNLPLVLSGKSDDWFRKQYKALHINHPDIDMYEQSLSPQNHLEFLKQYAIGLVWYSPASDANENDIGLSSGKLFRHLSIGQPVIVSPCPGLSSVVEKYKLGVVINNISELSDAYAKIMNDYSQYLQNIKRIYINKFDYSKIIQPFLREMEKM